MKRVSGPRKKIALVIVIAVAVIIVVSMFPYKHFLAPEPKVTVKSATTILSVSGDFSFSTMATIFKPTRVSTMISEKEYANSFLNFSLIGQMYGCPLDGGLVISLNVVIHGHLAPNLDPKYLGLEVNAVSPKGFANLSLGSLEPAPSKNQDLYINTSIPKDGPPCPTGNSDNLFQNTAIGLENEPKWSLFHGYPGGFYNFALGNQYYVHLISYTGTHYFRFSVSLPGLRETPYANITVETVYKGS
ncbi:MAG: hypothetical protein ACYCXG_12725 [Acidiferrobacter sp.]|jgi:hypothetical protein